MLIYYLLDEFAEPSGSAFEYGGRECWLNVDAARKEEALVAIEKLREEWHTTDDVGDVCLEDHIRAGLDNLGLLVRPKVVRFSELIHSPIGEWLDAHFTDQGWELQEIDGEYQVYFGRGVQVDNRYEYGFPHLVTKEDLLVIAEDFYNKNYSSDV